MVDTTKPKPKVPKTPKEPKAPKVQNSETAHLGKAERMRLHLAKQPKVPIMIPLSQGEVAGSTESVILNGYPPIAGHTGNSIPEIHEICKQMFLAPRQMSIGDEMITVPGSTARLTSAEMGEYIERVIALAGELGCHVMSPSEAGFIPNSAPPVTGYGIDA